MIYNDDCFNVLPTLSKKSVDLILVDPPYGISRDSLFTKTNENTSEFMAIKYGKISIDFGDWDKEDIDFDLLFSEYYRVLKPGGTLIFFYDIWKSTFVKECAERNGFKQPRVCQWHKTNPVPINSKRNYLSNAIEFFFTFVKGKKPTFHSEYDNGVYKSALCHGKERFDHPTQKPLSLITEIVAKHSSEGDVVLDTFAGTGTTAMACQNLGRRFIVVERDPVYFAMIEKRLCQQNNEDQI
jgi:DNA modification methylase